MATPSQDTKFSPPFSQAYTSPIKSQSAKTALRAALPTELAVHKRRDAQNKAQLL